VYSNTKGAKVKSALHFQGWSYENGDVSILKGGAEYLLPTEYESSSCNGAPVLSVSSLKFRCWRLSPLGSLSYSE